MDSRRGSQLEVLLVTPAPRYSKKGNRVTAERWARQLKSLGCGKVRIAESFQPGTTADLLIAVHAVKSAESISSYRKHVPHGKIVLILSGTDIHPRVSRIGVNSMELANRLVALQPMATQMVSKRFHPKTSVIYQSAVPPKQVPKPLTSMFEVCVVGHLRTVKDPFRAAFAAKLLPTRSRIQIRHYGEALSDSLRKRAIRLSEHNNRYRWLGGQPRWRTKQRVARCRLMVISSRNEGGASAIAESIVAGTPVLASYVPGNIGMLGEDYDGFFEFQDTRGVRDLLLRCEEEHSFYNHLVRQSKTRSKLMSPRAERASLKRLLNMLMS